MPNDEPDVIVWHNGTTRMVEVSRPNPAMRHEGETWQAFLVRAAGVIQAKTPHLAGMTFTLANDDLLPARTRVDAQGDKRSVRNGWRWADNKVVVSEPDIPIDWGGLEPALRRGIPDVEWPVGMLRDLRDAVIDRDPSLLAAWKSRALADFNARYHGHINSTFTAKGADPR